MAPNLYNIKIKFVDGIYIAEIRELCLLAKGTSAQQAVENVEVKKRVLFDEYSEVGLDQTLPQPNGKISSRGTFAAQLSFAIKAAIIALVIVTAIFSAEIAFKRALSTLPHQAAIILTDTIDYLGQVSQWVGEERKREIGRNLKLLIENLQPLIDEVHPALSVMGNSKNSDPPSTD